MKNVLNCGYSRIYIHEAMLTKKDFIKIKWSHSEINKTEICTSTFHINTVNLQKTISDKFETVFELNGVYIQMDAYNIIEQIIS